ncbi:S-adenosylmethionine:tRNA ribosyltransferase-isomerase [Hymenobacter rubripertinctus]|uniref:S-adenosylmethionine:tRNA ribosyltransferase-isomerase n=1 Tax=Hymenobacter rubripertinctus TaxID=2029981 RepID=A0A418R431_9BACT|nr:S-adenosylmethionine:tRNA ribosyltransferase-isomerase [Hymenobacter rubripertinctus]RIY12203.1 S-adenosylmethionine:tRNA ribosyltransferase-isomerase [Hymenobacter rubripertinctus]
MSDPRQLSIHDFTYELPADRIAPEPLPSRDQSRLLVCERGIIEDRTFLELPGLLPADSLLVFNDTKVVRARLFARRPTGGLVELFCLEPVSPHRAIEPAMQQTQACVWKCLVGNGRRWKDGPVTVEFEAQGQPAVLRAKRVEQHEGYALIAFSWAPDGLPFAEVLRGAGHLPLPPYLNRADTDVDAIRYQTVYASQEGAVAAPTAGLHFSEAVLAELAERRTAAARVTLHVGAGTFQPVKARQMSDHPMHGEPISVTAETLSRLLAHLREGGPIIPVGTTSLRTLESLYWLGAGLVQRPALAPAWHVGQWQPYEPQTEVPAAAALAALLAQLELTGSDTLHATTQLLIAPGYRFRLVQGLITNFHQPESTLLLLVAALIGADWRRVYDHALAHHYRFLSYGDSSLLLP